MSSDTFSKVNFSSILQKYSLNYLNVFNPYNSIILTLCDQTKTTFKLVKNIFWKKYDTHNKKWSRVL